MEQFNRFAAPATAKLRQLQKIVQDINKNEGSLLNKLRKLKAKSGPKVPERDYQGEHFEDRWSDESDEYDDPQEDGYEPPPSHRVFSPSTASPFTRDDYVDSCRHRSYHGPRKPPRPAKATKPLPPEPHQMASDEEDYIDPESGNHDNYIDPTPPPSVHSSSVASKPLLKVPDTSGPNTQSQSLPSKFSPSILSLNHLLTLNMKFVTQIIELDIHRQPWYANTCDRKTAEEVLIESNKDGSFMVRKSSGQVAEQPYTLVVLYNSKVYNIPVRFIKATQQYALGREKKGEEHFTSVSRIIENHLKVPLVLIDSQSNTRDTTKLQHAVRP
ncbi:unnamed protein product [Merluccius merluccius]